jgi:hypothetical protein
VYLVVRCGEGPAVDWRLTLKIDLEGLGKVSPTFVLLGHHHIHFRQHLYNSQHLSPSQPNRFWKELIKEVRPVAFHKTEHILIKNLNIFRINTITLRVLGYILCITRWFNKLRKNLYIKTQYISHY